MKNENTTTSPASFKEEVMAKLERDLPVIFARHALPKLLGEALAAGTLANLGKEGPKYLLIGRNAVYEKDSFLEWLRGKIKIPNQDDA